VKIEHFPFRDGEHLIVSTYAGYVHDGTLVAINPDGLMLSLTGSSVVMVPWSNVADVKGVDLRPGRVGEIAETFTRPSPITTHPALAEEPAPYSDQWLANRQEI
jgi:hypothetical protein